jgi:hypothetical protein
MNTTTDERGLYQLGFVAAVFALSALLVGGVIMTVTSSAQTAG